MVDGSQDAELAQTGHPDVPVIPRRTPVDRVRQENYVFFVVLNYCALLGIFVHLAFIPLFAWLDVAPMVWFNCASVAVWVAGFLANRWALHTVALALILLEAGGHAVAAVYHVGSSAGFQYYLFLAPLIVFFSPLRTTGGKVLLVLAPALLYLGLDLYDMRFAPAVDIPTVELGWVRFGNILITLTVMSAVSYYYHRVTEESRAALHAANQRLRVLATTDPLTGLLNRRRMCHRLEAEAARSGRSGQTFSILMADIDHFKRVNDVHGHDTGDRLLQQVARALLETVRSADSVARWGGEEFLVLLPETDLAGARRVGEKLRTRIAAAAGGAAGPTPSITVGVAACAAGEDVEECIGRADRALYAGKTGGRDRVETA